MRLIVEEIQQPEFIVEQNNGQKDWFIVGKYIIGEERNKNGRVYPIDVLENSVQKYIDEKVNKGMAYGELGHPSGPTVNLDRASHRVLELKQHGNVFEGKSILVNRGHGAIAIGLLETGGKLGVSTRGMGSLQEKNGAMEVQKDFRLSSVDIVSDPSGPGCFVNGIMEGVEYFYDPVKGTWKEEKVEELAKYAKKLTKEEREVKALALFEAYFNILANEGFRDFVARHQGKWADAKSGPKRTEHDNHADRLIKQNSLKAHSQKFNQNYSKFHSMAQGDDFEGGKKGCKK